jgi:hypothetical protein
MWGVSDPAESARGRGRGAEAGSLTPHLGSDSCAGALTGRHRTPPDIHYRNLANFQLHMHLERALYREVVWEDWKRL